MIPSSALPDLLAAERGLARLDAGFRDVAQARRHACDASRRVALAVAQIDGMHVDAEDLLLAVMAADEVDLPRRADAAAAAAVYRLLLALRDGLRVSAEAPPAAPRDGRLRPETVAAWTSLTVETRRLLAEAEAALQEDAEAVDGGDGGPRPLAAWTLAWVEELHARWHAARHGRRPAPWGVDAQQVVREILHLVEDALAADPGLAGAARALHRLHHAAEMPSDAPPRLAAEDERSEAIRRYMAGQTQGGWWPQFARVVAPHLIARACRLEALWLPLAACWARDLPGYRLGVGGSEEDWIIRMARWTADAVEAEGERIGRIEARQARWIEATAVIPRLPKRRSDTLGPTRRQRTGTRRSTGRLPRLLDLLWEQPVVSARAVERRLGMTYRSALDLIGDLETAGVLRRATDRKLDRLWRAAVV